MLCSSTSLEEMNTNINNIRDINESDLSELLKHYYRLCRQSADKTALIKDQTLIKMLGELLTDQRQNIAIYTCKILLLLSEQPEQAKLLSEQKELKSHLDNALSFDYADGAGQPSVLPKILNKLFIVQTRCLNATKTKLVVIDEKSTAAKRTIFGGQRGKQLVFAFDRPSDMLLRQIERKCVNSPGVMSICFQQIDGGSETRCLIRCRENVEDRELIQTLFSVGNIELVRQLVRGENDEIDTLDFYAAEFENRKAENEWRNEKKMPKYLDDEDLFDPSQCIATKEQIGKSNEGGGWFASLKSMIW